VPATAALIAAIAALPNGAVVLPGLDRDLDPDGWQAVAAVTGGDLVHGHAQAMLRRLVDEHLRMDREAVQVLGVVPGPAAARARVLLEALRPAESHRQLGTARPRRTRGARDRGDEQSAAR
jgi:ATP-dependent helicase/nuclease subunit B